MRLRPTVTFLTAKPPACPANTRSAERTLDDAALCTVNGGRTHPVSRPANYLSRSCAAPADTATRSPIAVALRRVSSPTQPIVTALASSIERSSCCLTACW